MKRQIFIAGLGAGLLAVTLAGCGQVKQATRSLTPDPATQTTSGGPITLSGTPSLSAPAPIRQEAPRAQNWRRDLPRNIAYFNMGDSGISIYDGSDATNATGQLLPGEGGYIQTCDDAKPMCKMNFGNGRTGWVAMSSMAGVSS
ncbi:hypothetical protein [Sagittula salina]|uniref:SH3 domain-containing protein n=1 Tax=Sagittula salina TaxID=2820268 RepID=A0A940MLM4_9RHOB|nr:hypothetical protein [Sagittula salina]MBP0481843.1 hypothetical protein [Sagittula salina]